MVTPHRVDVVAITPPVPFDKKHTLTLGLGSINDSSTRGNLGLAFAPLVRSSCDPLVDLMRRT